jgi:hypothetical protein
MFRTHKICKQLVLFLLLGSPLLAADGDPVIEGKTASSISATELKAVTTLDATTTTTVNSAETDPVYSTWDKDFGDLINAPDSLDDLSGTTDDVTQGSTNKYADTTKENHGETAYSWGDHGAEGYLTAEVDGSTTNEIEVEDAAYAAGWNGDTTHAPSQNAIYDKIEAIAGGTMTYPDAGIAVSTGSAWATSIIPADGYLKWTGSAYAWDTPSGSEHNAVTLGTANGLSLSTQELSLGLSSTSTTGALSDTDWDTFNGKQAGDADLTAIAALSTTGFAKRTGSDTWSLDTNTYLTANQTITLSGDATGSGTEAITVVVVNDSHSHTSTTLPATISYLGATIGTAEVESGVTIDTDWNTAAKINTATTDYDFWHSNNDGAASGLDADLWDGYQFASYLNQAVKTTSSPTFAAETINGNITVTGTVDGRDVSVDGATLDAIGNTYPIVADTDIYTNRGSNITSTTLSGTSTAGLYRVQAILDCTTADTDNAYTADLTISWTDVLGVKTATTYTNFTSIARQSIDPRIVQLSSGSITYTLTSTGWGTAKVALYIVVERLY